MVDKIAQKDYLIRGSLAEVDPEVAELIRHETARQARYLIMIPSSSTAPLSVLEGVGSAFGNIYAEGYPLDSQRRMSEEEILDYGLRLPEFRRNSDNRYYKGTEYANLLESLARRRTAEAFASEHATADQLYVNVQPLSGAPANNAVYTALTQPGDTVMSMDLVVGGHLSHGAPVNRSGKFFNIVSYAIDPETEQLNYDRMLEIALEHKPKILIGGYSSYPIAPDWHAYRRIADACGAILLADVAHFAGLIAAGVYPNPVGIADIVTFTTHKTLNGPRGAVIITHRKDLSAKIDRGVFPGEQGGPHMNIVAGIATAMKFAQTDSFKALQTQTVANARRLVERLTERGLRVPHGGTDSHMLVVDLKPIKGADGTSLSGDMAARILDLCGIVANRQTIPGDTSALRPSGIRLGTPWITQRGFGLAEIDRLADIIADVLLACKPFSYTGKNAARAKLDFDLFQQARLAVRELVDQSGIDTDVAADGYPHFAYLDDSYPAAAGYTFTIRGDRARDFLNVALTSNVNALGDGDKQVTQLLEVDGVVMAAGTVERLSDDRYALHVDRQPARVAAWLRSLSDGFVLIDHNDPYAKVPGPVEVLFDGVTDQALTESSDAIDTNKPYFIGLNGENFTISGSTLPMFEWTETEGDLKQTPLHALHQELGAKMAPFAGYDMPLWYDKVLTEHLAVRERAGIFDVTHMGVFEAVGPDAEAFLDTVAANDVSRLNVGSSHYTFALDVNGQPLDDFLIYRLDAEHFFIVVNASNNDKLWAWFNAVKDGQVRIDNAQPSRRVTLTNFTLRDLRDPSAGDDRRVDIALQGPASRDILLALGGSPDAIATVKGLPWAGITRVTLGDFDLIVSRTGYTGERTAFEVFPQTDQASDLFQKLVELGATPCGLAARDSLRIEAGLPLYGHELSGSLGMNPADAGMGSFVKLYKPFFVGKSAFIAHEAKRDSEISRFRMINKGARPAHPGDPIVDSRGRVVGIVTSCSIDSDGYQLGHVYLKSDYRKKGVQLAVFAGSERIKPTDYAGLDFGSRTTVPEPVEILTRFPSKKK